MGNLIVQGGKLRLQKTKLEVMINLGKYIASVNNQIEVFNKFAPHWKMSGFSFSFKEMNTAERANEFYQERFATDIAINTGKELPPHEQTIYPENYFYIDLERADSGSAYQLSWKPILRDTSSSYVSISTDRGVLQADILHEVGHGLGLAHEHQRIDRDAYVVPIDDSQYEKDVNAGQQIAPDRMASSVPFGPYDPESIMHYPATFRLRNNGSNIGGTIAKPEFPIKLSLGDICSARFLYNESRVAECLDGMNDGLSLQYRNDQLDMREKPARELQAKRQKYLLYVKDDVVKKTFKVVCHQRKQLRQLNLPIQEQDEWLYQWAKSNLELSEKKQSQYHLSKVSSHRHSLFKMQGQSSQSLQQTVIINSNADRVSAKR